MRVMLLGLASSAVLAGSGSAQAPVPLKASAQLTHPFSSITGLRELDDGRVLVSDGIDGVLLRADFATGRLDTLGRAGQGPGEYRSPDALFAMPGGATLLVDLGNARLSLFDAAGRYRESLPIMQGSPGAPGGLRLLIPSGTDQAGRIYYQPRGDAGGDSGVVVRWDRRAGATDTLARIKLPAIVSSSSGGPNNRSVSQRPHPYPLQDGWAVAPDGRVALVRSPQYRVDWVDPSGRLRRGSPLPDRPVRIGAAEKREFLEEQAASGVRVQAENRNGQVSVTMSRGGGNPDQDPYGADEWPPAKPPFAPSGLRVAPDGRLWVERPVPAGAPRIYDIVGADGAVTGRVTLPAGYRIVGLGARGVYARRLDDDGISWLERFDRPGSK